LICVFTTTDFGVHRIQTGIKKPFPAVRKVFLRKACLSHLLKETSSTFTTIFPDNKDIISNRETNLEILYWPYKLFHQNFFLSQPGAALFWPNTPSGNIMLIICCRVIYL
jgi:hypothetical protein